MLSILICQDSSHSKSPEHQYDSKETHNCKKNGVCNRNQPYKSCRYDGNQGVYASPPGKAPGLVSISHIPKTVEATINKIGIENRIMIVFPSLRYFVSFMKNNPKKKRNSHPG